MSSDARFNAIAIAFTVVIATQRERVAIPKSSRERAMLRGKESM
jgi:hypothetical protein